MTDLLLTSSLPYWFVFIIMAACSVVCFIYRIKYPSDSDPEGTPPEGRPVSRQLMLAVSAASLFVAIFEIAVYMTVGTKCLWWCTGDDLGFFAKLLRELPLIIFLGLQVIQAFLYKLFMDNYLSRNLSIMPTAIGFLAVLPVCIVLYIVLSIADVAEASRNTIFYITLTILMVGAISYALIKNIKECGKPNGIIFTVVTSLLFWASLISLMLFIASIIQLLFQTALILVALYIGRFAFKGMNNAIIYNSDQKTVYRDMDGDLHYTRFGAEQANERISRKR